MKKGFIFALIIGWFLLVIGFLQLTYSENLSSVDILLIGTAVLLGSSKINEYNIKK